MTRFESIFRASRAPHLALIAALLLQVVAVDIRGGLQDYEGKEVASVEFRGNRTLPEESLLYYLGLEPGSVLSQKALNESIQELWDTGLIDDIAVEAELEGEGVKLIVTLVERPVMKSIDYVGLKRVSRDDIDERIAVERIRVYEGDTLRWGELRRLEREIEALYREKGYRFADAKISTEAVSAGELRVVFTIDEGNRVRIEDIKFEGNTVYSDWRLRQSMKKTRESGLLSKPLKRDIYNPAKLQEDLEAVKDLYKKIGYKNITIGEPVIEVRALKPNAPKPEDQKRRMFIIVPVEEGERWKFGEITIAGNEKYSDQQLLSVFQQRRGDWLRSKKLAESIEALEEVYKNTGYISARVRPELVEKEERTADLVVHVDEGDQFRVGRIDFEGNTRTRDKVLRREMRVYEGLVLSLRSVQNSLLKIRQLGYFKVDEEEPVQILNVNDEKKTIDLLIKGQEADRTELQFGGGWSEFDGFFAQLGLRTQNFLGRGETLAVQFQSGRVRNFFDVSYAIPWFLDRPQQIGLRAFKNEEDFSLLTGQSLKRDSSGGTLTYGRNFRLFQSMAMSYTNSDFSDTTTFVDFERDENGQIILDPMGQPIPRTIVSDLNFRNSSLRPVYSINSVDSPFEPTRGMKFTLALDYAGGFLGGTQDFIRPELGFTWFKPLSKGRLKTVFGFNTRAGYIEPFDDYRLSRLDRFFLGGENSVRGYSFRSIWVRDENGNTVLDNLGIPLGGDKYFQVNLEYHFLTNSPFRVLFFADAGGVFSEDQNIDFDLMRKTAGIELRVLVPLFGAPLRFIYAQNLDPFPDDRFDSFDFTIGASF